MTDDDVADRFDKLDAKLERIEARLEQRLSDMRTDYIPAAVLDERYARQGERIGVAEDRLSALEADRKWLTRTTGGAVITALLGLVIAVPTALGGG